MLPPRSRGEGEVERLLEEAQADLPPRPTTPGGSRVLLASAELRAPLVGLFKGRLDYGPLPIELALFADAGVAWTSRQSASFLVGDRSLLTSVGAALRVNVLGFLVAQVSAARPLDRPGGKGWVWQWSFAPGF